MLDVKQDLINTARLCALDSLAAHIARLLRGASVEPHELQDIFDNVRLYYGRER